MRSNWDVRIRQPTQRRCWQHVWNKKCEAKSLADITPKTCTASNLNYLFPHPGWIAARAHHGWFGTDFKTFFGFFWIFIAPFGVRRGLKMILSHRALSSFNMSSYRAIWTHFRQLSIFCIHLILQTGKAVGTWDMSTIHSPRIHDRSPIDCLLYTSPSPRDKRQSRMPSSA